MFEVKDIQQALVNHGFQIAVDGALGPKTEAAIIKFQKKNNVYADGIVGPVTAEFLFNKNDDFKDVPRLFSNVKIDCDKYGAGANVTYLREDAAKSFENVAQELRSYGAIVTSSGGRRLLTASVGANRSKTSLHYLGVAHDLFVWSGLVDPNVDPYVAERNGERGWTVWARCKKDVGVKTLNAYTYDQKQIVVTGNFVNLTEIMDNNGWKGINARKSFFTNKNKMGAEWWHFQHEASLEPGTRFGDELLKSYRKKKLEQYSVWNYRNLVWKKDWF